MKITGKKLKSAREEQRVSVNEVAMATKISPRLLQAIEEGDVDALPAKTFLRGFVQSYASYLKLDVDELLEVFHEEMGSTLPATGYENKQPTVEEKEEKKSPRLMHENGIWPKVIAGGVILALVFLIIGVKNIIEKYEREANTAPAPTDISKLQNPDGALEQQTDTASKDVANAPSEDKTTKESSEAKVKPTKNSKSNPEETKAALIKKIEKPNVETPPEKVIEQVKIEPKPEPKNPEAIVVEKKVEVKKSEPVVKTTDTEKPADIKKPSSSEKSKNEIIVEALDVVEIEFRVGNGDMKRITLKPDQIHTIKALGPVNLNLSDGGAVNLIHNGRDKGVPGDLGKPKRIKIQ